MNGKLVITSELFVQFLVDRGISTASDLSEVSKIDNIKPINAATTFDAAFCRFEGDQGLNHIKTTNAGLIFIPESLQQKTDGIAAILIPCKFPRLEMLQFISRFWSAPESEQNFSNNPSIHKSARIADDVKIGPFSVIGYGVVIGAGTRIGPNCHIENTCIGSNVKIASSVIIGGSGFGYEDDPVTGETLEFPHVGGVEIGNNVSIGSGTCIDRGSIGNTVIEDGVKIDNLVHIAHNVRVGKRSKIIALSIVGGSVDIGEDSWISPGVAIRDWVNIGKGALVGIGAVVTKNVEIGAVVVGNPAKPFPKKIDRYK